MVHFVNSSLINVAGTYRHSESVEGLWSSELILITMTKHWIWVWERLSSRLLVQRPIPFNFEPNPNPTQSQSKSQSNLNPTPSQSQSNLNPTLSQSKSNLFLLDQSIVPLADQEQISLTKYLKEQIKDSISLLGNKMHLQISDNLRLSLRQSSVFIVYTLVPEPVLVENKDQLVIYDPTRRVLATLPTTHGLCTQLRYLPTTKTLYLAFESGHILQLILQTHSTKISTSVPMCNGVGSIGMCNDVDSIGMSNDMDMSSTKMSTSSNDKSNNNDLSSNSSSSNQDTNNNNNNITPDTTNNNTINHNPPLSTPHLSTTPTPTYLNSIYHFSQPKPILDFIPRPLLISYFDTPLQLISDSLSTLSFNHQIKQIQPLPYLKPTPNEHSLFIALSQHRLLLITATLDILEIQQISGTLLTSNLSLFLAQANGLLNELNTPPN